MSQPNNRDSSDALDVLADTANNELRRSTSGGGNDSGSDSNGEGTSPLRRPSLAKKDGLRKGKWLEEEEEYTSRVIHHFGSGIFVLPEGKTLRAFLADKLQCDPMRITKKFAGAACLSKKIHSLSGRSEFTPREIETARLEIKLLEERFLIRLERGPYAVLPPIKTPVVTTTSSPPLRQTSNAITSGDALTDSTGLASLALLAYNAQLAVASKNTATLSYVPPSSNATIQQAVPAAAPPFAAIPQTQAPATINLQAAVQSQPQATDVNQQLTQTLVSQLLTQLQSLSPDSLSQLHNQLFLGTATSPPVAQNSALVTNNIMQSLQSIQQGASQGQASIFQEAANGGRQQPAVMPYITPRPAITTTQQHPTYAGAQQQQNNSKSLKNPAAGFLAELQRGHDAALRQIRREAKKRKKTFTMPSQSSLSLESGVSIVSSTTSGARSKNPSDNEVSSSSTDLPTSDSTRKGCESSSSSPSCSDEEKDGHSLPLRKRFKASMNSGGMTYRALQDHDERMARNDKM